MYNVTQYKVGKKNEISTEYVITLISNLSNVTLI